LVPDNARCALIEAMFVDILKPMVRLL